MTKKAKTLAINNEIVTTSGTFRLFHMTNPCIPNGEMPQGVEQITPVQIKFDTPGQDLVGQYCGYSQSPSTFQKDALFCFHEVKLNTGCIVGFIGSTQLDRALTWIKPFEKDVHIILVEIKDLGPDRTFKSFQIFMRNHVNKEGEKKIEPIPDAPF